MDGIFLSPSRNRYEFVLAEKFFRTRFPFGGNDTQDVLLFFLSQYWQHVTNFQFAKYFKNGIETTFILRACLIIFILICCIQSSIRWHWFIIRSLNCSIRAMEARMRMSNDDLIFIRAIFGSPICVCICIIQNM